ESSVGGGWKSKAHSFRIMTKSAMVENAPTVKEANRKPYGVSILVNQWPGKPALGAGGAASTIIRPEGQPTDGTAGSPSGGIQPKRAVDPKPLTPPPASGRTRRGSQTP